MLRVLTIRSNHASRTRIFLSHLSAGIRHGYSKRLSEGRATGLIADAV
jgi:hypothetical protein